MHVIVEEEKDDEEMSVELKWTDINITFCGEMGWWKLVSPKNRKAEGGEGVVKQSEWMTFAKK